MVPRPLRMLSLALAALLAATGCGSDDKKKQQPGDQSIDFTGTPVQRMNQFRSQAGLMEVSDAPYLANAATKHAGYQAYDATIGHAEASSPISNPFFVAPAAAERIGLAATAASVPVPSLRAELLTLAEDWHGIDVLWHTVYHRLPMMRHRYQAAGFGDADAAMDLGLVTTLDHQIATVEVALTDPVASALASLDGKYFSLLSADGTPYHVWFKRSAGATAPAVTGSTAIMADIQSVSSGATITVAEGGVAAAIYAALSSHPSQHVLVVQNGAWVTILLRQPGGDIAISAGTAAVPPGGGAGVSVAELAPAPPSASTTVCLAGETAVRALSFWPANGQLGVERQFNTDTETPDPVDAGNANGTPDDDVVGCPIHVIHPVNADFQTLNITLTQVAGGVVLPCHILAGGALPTVTNHPGDVHADPLLDQGEIFILPKSALLAQSSYRVQVSGSIAGMTLTDLDWTFTTR